MYFDKQKTRGEILFRHRRLCFFFFFALIPARKRGSLFTELGFGVGFRVGFRFGFRVGFSSWIFELDFRVRIFWRFFFSFGGISNKFLVVLHNALCQWCCTSSRGLIDQDGGERGLQIGKIIIGLFNIISSSNTSIENQLTYKQGSK